ncbi:hypothetical protein [Mesorhizobium sp. M0767]|uniref:hypothetical protein n=1 Tax=Mesorhizobium sp. M0767 TaxID=2956995 RepID=UPI00333DB21A
MANCDFGAGKKYPSDKRTQNSIRLPPIVVPADWALGAVRCCAGCFLAAGAAQPSATNLAFNPDVSLLEFDSLAICRCTSALLLTRSAQGLKKKPAVFAVHLRCLSSF